MIEFGRLEELRIFDGIQICRRGKLNTAITAPQFCTIVADFKSPEF
jgi:hypothetical protein